jgi:hypothetical protein
MKYIGAKIQQITSGFSKTLQYIILCYLDDEMCQSLEHQQVMTCSAHNIHVIGDPIRLTSHTLQRNTLTCTRPAFQYIEKTKGYYLGS